MSFLNALASDGLSVGLRFYNARMNSRTNEVQAEQSCGVSEEQNPLAAPEKANPAKPSPKIKTPETSEEMAAGRAEAQAMLAADGSLGRLAASKSQDDAEAEGDPEADPSEGSDGSQGAPVAGGGSPGGKQLTPEEQREVERLKAQEAQIKAAVNASVQKGVPGANSVQFTYTEGPDENRYISGIQGGQSGTGNPAASVEKDLDDSGELSEEEEQQVQDMQQRDREVRTHEQAHVAAAAGLAGAPVYEYQTGPDGKRYAVGGHVDVRTSGSSNPDVALREAEAVKRAATAPADPSGPDRAAAAQASAQINQIKAEKAGRSLSNDENGDNEAQGARGSSDGRAYGSQQDSTEEADGIFNGSTFSRQVVGAYAAVKFGSASMVNRPVLAQA